MKKIIIASVLFSLCLAVHSQDNKPEANSFGLQYGVSYGGTLNQSLNFSGWLKKGIEVRGGLIVSFTQTDNQSGDNTTLTTTSGSTISGYNNSETKSGSVTFTPDIAVLKHFTTKSNIDPFIGGLFSTALNMQTIQTQNINETNGFEYDRYSNILSKNPIVTTFGLSLVGGVNYFFAKNFAIGIDAGFGFTGAITDGKRDVTYLEQNSGANNPGTTNSTMISGQNSKVQTYNLNLSGNGGLRFSYYIRIKNHKKAAGVI